MPYFNKDFLFKIFSLIFLGHFLVPYSVYNSFGIELDPSYFIALNLAVENGFIFGKDFIFTYGPLGILALRLPIIVPEYLIIFFDIYLISNLLIIIYLILKNNFSPVYVILTFLVILTLRNFYGPEIVWPLLFIFYFMCYYSLRKKTFSFPLLNAIFLVNLLFYIKLNLGLIVYLVFFVFLLYALFTKGLHYKTIAFSFCLSFIFLFLAAHLLKVDIVNYTKGSLALVDAYNDAMYLKVFKEKYLWMALMIIAAYILLLFLNVRIIFKNSFSILVIFFTSLSVYVLFKQGFVRADGHLYAFFQFITLLFVLPWFFLTHLRNHFSYLVIFSLAISCIPLGKYLIKSTYRGKNLYSYYAPEKFYLSYEYSRESVQFPEYFINEIGEKTTDIIPWSISYIYFNDLKYNPRPVIQSYSAYNGYLDLQNQQKYLHSSAPDYIFYEIGTVDGRYHLWDETRTKLALLQRYNVDKRWNEMFLLKKTENLQPVDTLEKINSTIRLNEWAEIPSSDRPCIAKIKIKYSLLGKLIRLLFQPPDLQITLSSDKDNYPFRAVKTLIEDGIIINKQVFSSDDMDLFFRSGGLLNDNFNKFLIHSSQSWGFIKNIEVEYYKIQIPFEPYHSEYKSITVKNINVPETTDLDVNICIDKISFSESFLRIKGWSYLNNGSDSEKIKKYIVLASSENKFVFGTNQVIRKDVSTFFNNDKLDFSGFSSFIDLSDIPSGNYKVGIVLENDLKEYFYASSDQVINYPVNQK